jgi:hypothetical protein
MLSQAAVVFPQPVSSEQDRDTDETETDKDLPARRTMNSAARALYSLQYDPRFGRNDVLSPPGPMIPNLASGKPWFHDLLTCKPLKDFVKFGLRAATLNGEAEERVAAVLDVMEDRSCVQEACKFTPNLLLQRVFLTPSQVGTLRNAAGTYPRPSPCTMTTRGCASDARGPGSAQPTPSPPKSQLRTITH